jgi:hypothetical protein
MSEWERDIVDIVEAVSNCVAPFGVGELTHVIGGNVKALFQGSTNLSLPVTDAEPDAASVVPAAGERVVRMVSRQQPFSITLLSRRAPPTHRPPPLK